MIDFETEQDIRAIAGTRIMQFEDWATASNEADSFAEIPWLDIVTAASLALMAVSKHLEAADDVVDRLSRLYNWLVKKQPEEKPPQTTLSERVIVLLADQLARHKTGLTLEELAERTLEPVPALAEELNRLQKLSIAVEERSIWILKTRQ